MGRAVDLRIGIEVISQDDLLLTLSLADGEREYDCEAGIRLERRNGKD